MSLTLLEKLVPYSHLEQLVPYSHPGRLVPYSHLEQLVLYSHLEQLVPYTHLEQLVSDQRAHNVDNSPAVSGEELSRPLVKWDDLRSGTNHL
jgi:hypothetical protein